MSNASGTVLLDKPYLFTEVNQDTAPKQPVIIPQNELKKFQELEIEPDAPVTENNQQEDDTLLAQNEDEIKELIKNEIFNEDEDLGIWFLILWLQHWQKMMVVLQPNY